MSSEKIIIEPFIGKEYGKPDNIFGAKKILALGESLYINEEDYAQGKFKELTKDLVAQYLYFRRKKNFSNSKYIGGWTNTYLKFERALVGRETNSAESEAIWNSIMFYNYLQTPITEGARTSGADNAYASSQDAFIEVIKENEPDVIIIWGVGILYEALPPTRENEITWTNKDFNVDGYKVYSGEYSWSNKDKEKRSATVVAIYHPSSGFSWQWWHDKVIANENILSGMPTFKDKTNKDTLVIPQDINKRIVELSNEIAEKEEELNWLIHLTKSMKSGK